MLNDFINRDRFLYALDLALNILYEPSSNTYFYALTNKEVRLLILIDLLKVKAILEYYIIDLSKYSLKRVIRDIRHLLLTIFLNRFIPRPRNIKRA